MTPRLEALGRMFRDAERQTLSDGDTRYLFAKVWPNGEVAFGFSTLEPKLPRIGLLELTWVSTFEVGKRMLHQDAKCLGPGDGIPCVRDTLKLLEREMGMTLVEAFRTFGKVA